MRIGITYDLKSDGQANGHVLPGQPDDFQEEFDSPATVEAIATVLRGLGHDVHLLGDGRGLLQQLLAQSPEFIFNFAEGQGIGRSREARVPAVLEMLGIPYSGSDPLTMAVTLDKDCARRLVQSVGVQIPRGILLPSPQNAAGAVQDSGLTLPVIVKPAWEGSSKGIRQACVVDQWNDLARVATSLGQDYRQPVLVEEFIEGDELTVGVLGNGPPQILGIMRVVPVNANAPFVYSLEVKRDYLRQVRYECPAPLGPATTAAIGQAALTAFQVLGCRDVARIDFRLRDGVPYFLEVNPLPGLNPEFSDLVIMARSLNWSYEKLIETILHASCVRQGLADPSANVCFTGLSKGP